MKKKFTYLFLLAALVFSSRSFAQNTCIGMDGTSLSQVNMPAQIVPASGDFTVEFWAWNVQINPVTSVFVSQGTVGSGAFYIGYDALGNITAGDNWTSTGVPMVANTWTHYALVYTSGTGTATLYLNGALVATHPGYSISSGASNFSIGVQTDGTENIQARMDELRIWNVARTAAQIKAGMYGTVSTSSTGLLAYYNMNEGAGTTLTNTTGNTAFNGAFGPDPADYPGWRVSPIEFNSNAINFTGVESILVPANSAYNLTSGTVELWVNPGSGIPAFPSTSDMVGVRGPGGANFSFHMSSGTTQNIGMFDNTTYSTLDYAPGFSPGTWYQLAFVCNGTNTTVYVDGTSIGVIPETFSGITGQPLAIGYTEPTNSEQFIGSIDEVRIWSSQRTPVEINAALNGTLTGNETGLVGLFSFDQGDDDPATIDVDGDRAPNYGLYTLIDNTANANNGTLSNNFVLGGTTSNFIPHSLPILPVNFTQFTVTGQDGQALLQWQTAQEENSSEYQVERSADGVNFQTIGSVPAAGNSATPRNYSFIDPTPLNGNNYYRLNEVDLDGKSMYSVVRLLEISVPLNKQVVWYKTGEKTVRVSLLQGSAEPYTVIDINGRTIQQGELSAGSMDLTRVAAGLYIVKIIAVSGEITTKVLVQ